MTNSLNDFKTAASHRTARVVLSSVSVVLLDVHDFTGQARVQPALALRLTASIRHPRISCQANNSRLNRAILVTDF
jgi:hypothetical protein